MKFNQAQKQYINKLIKKARAEKKKELITLIKNFYPQWLDDDVSIYGNMRMSGKYKNIEIELLNKLLKELK